MDTLVAEFGGKAKNWAKKATLDPASGMEIHYYENLRDNIGRRGNKWAGFPDPF